MVSKDFILKSIENAIVDKCETSSKARKLGATAQVSYEDGNRVFEYEDGTTITFNYEGGLVDVVFNGKNHTYFGDGCYDEFEYLKDELLTTETFRDYLDDSTNPDYANDWEFLKSYVDYFASWMGRDLNTTLRNGGELDKEGYFVERYHDWFVDLLRNHKIDHSDYATLRFTTRIHSNEDLDKKRVYDKAHVSTSVDGDEENKLDCFGNGDFDSSWKTVNLIEEDSGVTGLFIGTALSEGRNQDVDEDWEAEVNFAPKQKFDRVLIDEEHKIILQVPVVK